MEGPSVARFNQSGSGSSTVCLLSGAVCRGGTFSSSAPAKGGVDSGSGAPPKSFNQLKSCSEGAGGAAGAEGSDGVPTLVSQLGSSPEADFSSGTLKGWAG